MKEYQGTLNFNGERWELDCAAKVYEFHCGDCFDILVNGEWKTVRIEYDHREKEFYTMEGLPLQQGARIRVYFHTFADNT